MNFIIMSSAEEIKIIPECGATISMPWHTAHVLLPHIGLCPPNKLSRNIVCYDWHVIGIPEISGSHSDFELMTVPIEQSTPTIARRYDIRNPN